MGGRPCKARQDKASQVGGPFVLSMQPCSADRFWMLGRGGESRGDAVFLAAVGKKEERGGMTEISDWANWKRVPQIDGARHSRQRALGDEI